MTTLITMRFKKSDDQTNIDKFRVAANITEYHIISKLIFLDKHVLNWTYGIFGQNERIATLSTFYLTVSGIIIPSLKIT